MVKATLRLRLLLVGGEVEHLVEDCLAVAEDHAPEEALRFGEEFGRRSIFGQLTVPQDEDLVVLDDGLDPMGDRDHRGLANEGENGH